SRRNGPAGRQTALPAGWTRSHAKSMSVLASSNRDFIHGLLAPSGRTPDTVSSVNRVEEQREAD
ncbi:MAG: hypothetical protein ABSH05_12250, partial [Bryobacteraceae bacterium]